MGRRTNRVVSTRPGIVTPEGDDASPQNTDGRDLPRRFVYIPGWNANLGIINCLVPAAVGGVLWGLEVATMWIATFTVARYWAQQLWP